MDAKKLKFYWRLYWIRILLIALCSTLFITLVMVIVNGIRAWNEADSYLRQSQLATYPLQIFIWIIVGIIQGAVYTFMMYWMIYKRGGQFTQVSKKSVSGAELGIK